MHCPFPEQVDCGGLLLLLLSVQKERMKGVPMYYPGASPERKRPEVIGKWLSIQSSNYWEPLSDMLEEGDRSEESIDEASEDFINVTFEVARKLDMTKLGSGKGKRRKELLSKRQKRRMDERRKEYNRLQQMPEGDEKERTRQDYKESKNKLRQDIRRCNRKRWMEEQSWLLRQRVIVRWHGRDWQSWEVMIREGVGMARLL